MVDLRGVGSAAPDQAATQRREPAIADNSVRTVVAQYEDKATSRGLIGDLLTRLYFDVRRP